VLRDVVAEAMPGVVACFWFKNAAAARGKLREERRGKKRVRRNAEANSLTVVAGFAVSDLWDDLQKIQCQPQIRPYLFYVR
jgi:hypothetical protein